MMELIKKLYVRYRPVIMYGIFGVLTTAVNVAVYGMASSFFQLSAVFGAVLAWIAAVIFAYVTNRIWVFHSSVHTKREIIAEIGAFFGCRLFTGVLDVAGMWIFADIMHLNGLFVKMALNVIVIIGNYVASKVIIFRKRS